MMSPLLTQEEQAEAQKLIASGKLKPETLNQFLKAEEIRQKSALKTLAGQLCYVDHASQTLYIEDYQSEKIKQAYALKPEPRTTPKSFKLWGHTTVLSSYQDGTLVQALKLPMEKQGLLITAGLSYLSPITVEHTHMGISKQYYSPYTPEGDYDAYDLICSPTHDLLFVIHRREGLISLFSLPQGQWLGQFQIRETGSHCSMNLAVDVTQRKAYITDNESDQLYILDLVKYQLSAHSLFLGKLGNLALDRNPNYLYLEVLGEELSMAYLDLEHLTIITLLDIKGQSLCLHAGRPVDLMQFTPEKELLLFMTYLDSPTPFTPVIHVIETERTRTIRRYALKEGGTPQHLAIAHFNMHHFKSGELLQQLLHQITNTQPQQKKPVAHQLDGPPPITLPESAEDAIISICQASIESRYHINLRLHPMEKRKLRELATSIRKELEQELATEVTLEILHRFSHQLPISREQVIQTMALAQKKKAPLYLPQENCPICGSELENLPCTACGFKLEAPKSEPVQDKAIAKNPLNEAQENYIELLQRVSFLKDADQDLLKALARSLHNQMLQTSEVLIREGQVGSSLYFVMEGQLTVFKDSDPNQAIATLIEGDVVGEMAVVTSEKRSASVIAKEDCVLLRLERSDFIKVIIQHPDFSRQLKALAYTRQSMTRKFKNNLQRNTMDRVRARMAISKLQELKIFQNAPQEVFEALASKVNSVAFMPKQEVCEQGKSADRLFFIIRGSVDVLVNQEKLTSLSEGDLFGEMAWLSQQDRSATVVTTSYCKFMELAFNDFSEVIKHYPLIQKSIEELASQRQNELNDFEALNQPQVTEDEPLPGLEIGIHKYVPAHRLYYLSPLEGRVFRIENNQIDWSYGQQGDIRLFQPFRVQYSEAYEPALLITDTGNDRILEVEIEQRKLSRVWEDHELNLIQPRSACLTHQGWLLVADEGQQRLLMINLQKEIAWEYDRHVIAPHHVSQTPSGTILYTDIAMHQVIEINHEGEIIWTYGTAFLAGSKSGELSAPAFAERLPDGRTLIADTGNQRLIWVDAEEHLLEIWQGSDEYPLIDPVHCEWDDKGYLYVHSGTAENILCFSKQGEPVWHATLLPA